MTYSPPNMQPKSVSLPVAGVSFNARLTAILNVYHQVQGEQPTGKQIVFTDLLSQREDAYSRRIELIETWIRPDFGWVEKPKYVLIENLVMTNLRVMPTEEEAKQYAKQIVEVSQYIHDAPDPRGWLVYPRQAFFGAVGGEFFLRSLFGNAPIRLTVFSE